MNLHAIRKDFPILSRRVNGKRLVYLDNAATSQKPRQVIRAVTRYYERYNANVHRGVHTLSEEATEAYEEARRAVARFIHAASEKEIIFTKNTTESINLLAKALKGRLKKGENIVLTRLEHHSNLVPWQQLAKERGAMLRFIPLKANGNLDMKAAARLITKKTRIVATTHVSNVLGTIVDVRALAAMAHENGALMVVDAAQSAPHMPVHVQKLDCDFLAFSGHKMLGPTGVGVLYGKSALLEGMPPVLYGSDMIREVRYGGASWNDLPWKFEAGTPNIAGVIAMKAAVDYLETLGMENVEKQERKLTEYALSRLSRIPGIAIYGPKKRAGVIAFNLDRIHPHDLAAVLDAEGIAIRGGHHCAMPLAKLLGFNWSARASFYLYNGKDDVEALVSALKKVKKVFA